jgi:hypothetical protein
MKGNEALAEAAIQAGCKHFFGYPITPQTELAAYMSKKMPKIGGTYLQAESEVAAINMVLGAASAGVRAMTSSSSPGVSLKTEGISYMAGSDLPALIINEVIPREVLQGNWFLERRRATQDKYLRVIEDKFSGMIRSEVPLFETDIYGVENLRKVGKTLYGE